MKRFLFLTPLLLIACTDTSGISKESSRPPAGNPDAAVVVQEYGDLQCPACQSAHTRIVKPILDKYGSQIRYEFKHFPLRTIHRYALDAAEASECAADQGKFWEFVDLAYEKQSELNFDVLVPWAEELGLDTDLFELCWKSDAKKKTVLSDYEEGRKAGVQGTPTFFVNGEKVQSGFDTLSEAIEDALGGAAMRL